MLKAINLACQFHETPLFSGLNLQISPGHCLQITGGNGSGKTSLLRILAGLRWPDRGEIAWKNQPISTIKPVYARERFYLGHKPGLKPELTVSENLKLLLSLYQQPLGQINVLLEDLALQHHTHLPTQCLSVGQQKRLALTQLNAFNVKLWILDEPFAGLDQAGIFWLQNKIEHHLEKQGMVIFTSHQPIHLSADLLELTPSCFSIY